MSDDMKDFYENEDANEDRDDRDEDEEMKTKTKMRIMSFLGLDEKSLIKL